jgi:hypothetical protein
VFRDDIKQASFLEEKKTDWLILKVSFLPAAASHMKTVIRTLYTKGLKPPPSHPLTALPIVYRADLLRTALITLHQRPR